MYWTYPNSAAFTAAAAVLFSLASTTVAQSALRLIDISGDAATCPEGTQPSASYDGICSYGAYISNRRAYGKCCFEPTQLVFLQSVAGGEKHVKAAYKLDSQSCCSPGEEGTALNEGQCVYGINSLEVPLNEVTKCCWNATANDFSVHLKGDRPLSTLSNLNIQLRETSTNSVVTTACIYNYQLTVNNARVFSNRIELDVWLYVACGFAAQSGSTTLTIYRTKDYAFSGKLAFPLSFIGPTVYVDISTKINPDDTIAVHGRITGSGILGRLEEKFDTAINNGPLKEAISSLAVC
ncbi:hypothetical protein DE146DRAFT_642964 [Phaeosphaeria sp. MPI-PUGE-AT-0046c]|nr:hypothetical protein DE146DRAFT_642964 [Phaeosphaeria sp. MPI-PUGE-AT-0046c]